MNKHASAVGEIRQLCQLGLPARAIVPEVLQALHRLVPSYTNLFDWVDGEGQICDYYTEEPYEPQAARLYFDEFYNRREREVRAAFSEQVRHCHGVVARVQPDRSFYGSDFYNLVWRPRGVHHNLEAVVCDGGRPVGALTLYRQREDPPFSEHDERALAAVIPYLARAVGSGGDYRGRYVPHGRTGIVVVDRAGTLRFQCGEGRRLLYLARRATSDGVSSAVDAEHAAVPAALADWCRQAADAPACAAAATPASLQQHNAWGRFVFEARRLEPLDGDSCLIAIGIQRHVPLLLQVGRALQALPLSVRQRELCMLLAEGMSYRAIGERMHITLNTVISYARVVYGKLGLRGRDELHALLRAPAASA